MAVTFKHLYAQVWDFENLWLAYQKARRGKRYDEPVARFDSNAEENILQLQSELRDRCWTPGPYRHFYVWEPKKRRISAAPFRDRVVHHALVNVLEPIYEARFSGSSYACRKGKGTLAAMLKAHWGVRNCAWFLKGDIVKFFPSVDHEVLLSVLQRKIADVDVLAMIRVILDSGRGVFDDERPPMWFAGDDLLAPALRPKGLPIGNLTSQFFANVLLNELDQFVHTRLSPRLYVRYSDDFVLFDHDRGKVEPVRGPIEECLESLRLRMHPGKSHLRPSRQGLRFLGFRLLPSTRRVARENLTRFRRRMRTCGHLRRGNRITVARVGASVRGWLSHVDHANASAVTRRLLSDVRF
ncbi:MAG: reverse transcriptase domain-containing protein [bacterium]